MPSRSERNTTAWPSGVHVGSTSAARSCVSWSILPLARSTRTRSSQPPGSSREATSAAPSGLKRGPLHSTPGTELVRRWSPRPSMPIENSSLRSPSLRANTTLRPSGATSGSYARSPRVSRCTRPAGTSTRLRSPNTENVWCTCSSEKTRERPSGVQEAPEFPLRSASAWSSLPSARTSRSCGKRVSVPLV